LEQLRGASHLVGCPLVFGELDDPAEDQPDVVAARVADADLHGQGGLTIAGEAGGADARGSPHRHRREAVYLAGRVWPEYSLITRTVPAGAALMHSSHSTHSSRFSRTISTPFGMPR